MKTKLTTLLLLLVAVVSTANAQASSEECRTLLSLFSEPAKVKNYEAARPHFEKLLASCPQYNLALYQYGENLLEADYDKATDKKAAAIKILDLWDKRNQYFGSKTRTGTYGAKRGDLMYDSKGWSDKEVFDVYDAAFKEDRNSFVNPKSIYTYFSLAVDLNKAGQMDLQQVFDLYDETQAKITEENNELATKITPILEKEEAGTALTAAEKKTLKKEKNLRAYSIVGGSIDSKLGQLADCPNLIPLYNKDYEEKKNDLDWIKKAAGRLSSKDCTDDPLFLKLVVQLDKLAPSADTKLYLGQLEKGKGNMAQAVKYWEESAELQTDPAKKYRAYFKIAEEQRKNGSYGQARSTYMKALDANPSAGICWLRIAAMYQASANNCGDNVFDKRAVYWLAADTARKAGRVDPSLSGTASQTANSYAGNAPDKSMIFSQGKQGQTVKIGCWIGRSVRVPSL